MKSEAHPLRVLGKALILFLLINILFALINPSFGDISVYNALIPGRVRFPFGTASDPYVVMVDNLDVMAASHAIAATKEAGEYRVVLIGDSSVWGEKTAARDSISEQWNAQGLECNGRRLKFYNLGYPHPSVIKDLVILDKAMEYQPDMVVWFVTLNTLIPRRLSPFIAENNQRVSKILAEYDIPFSQEEKLALQQPSLFDRTLIGRRSDLARVIKLQVLGLLWDVTGQDKRISSKSPMLSPNVDSDLAYRAWQPGVDLQKKMLFSALAAGHSMANPVPVLIVNEPIYIATGRNSDIRYNDIYPRWAFDQYREALAVQANAHQWNYVDAWNVVPASFFSDTGLHVSAAGERLLIQQVDPILQKLACPYPME